MRKIYLLLLTLLSAVGAWAQPTVVATMQQLVNGATIKTATVSSDWRTDVIGGAVYSFGNGTFIGGIDNQNVLNAVNGDKCLIIAAWVYGQGSGCIFGYGDQNDGFKFQQTGTRLSVTTKGVKDMTVIDAAGYLKANQWNLLALVIPANQNTVANNKGQYYVGTENNVFWTKDDVTLGATSDSKIMAVPAAGSQIFAIGSGNQGEAREAYSGMIANLTILTCESVPGDQAGSNTLKSQIAEAVGAAPTYTLSGARAALQSKVDEIGGLIGDNPGYYSSANASTPLSYAQDVLGNSSSTVEQMVEKLDALNALSINMPVSGKNYLLISAFPEYENRQGVKKAMFAGSETYTETVDGVQTQKTRKIARWGTLSTDQTFKWTFTPNGSNYEVTNVAANEKMAAWASSRQILGETAANITLVSLGQGQFNIKNGGNVMHTGGHSGGSGTSGVIVDWGGDANSCSAWYIIDAEDLATTTYQIKEGETIVWSQEFKTWTGAGFPAPSLGWIAAFYNVELPTGSVTGTQTYDLTVTPKIKTFADASRVNTWYALDIHANEAKYPLYHSDGNLRVEYKSTPNNFVNADEYTRGAVKSDDYLWAFIGNPFGDGVKLYNRASRKYFVQATDGENAEVTLGEDASVFKVCSTTGTGVFEGAFALKVEGYTNYVNHRGTKMMGWNAADAGSAFRVWAANVETVSFPKTLSAEYGTLVLPFYSEIPTGLEIYTCPSVGDDNVVVLTPVTDWVRPNTAYIVKGEANQTYNFTNTTKDASTAAVTTGLLTGVFTDTTVPAESYVLAKKTATGKVGFFKVASGASVTCSANKCYLTVPASSARAFYFDAEDVETGINAVEIEEATPTNAVIYDLSGRRVQSAKSGLYIVNGKKVIK